MNTLKRAAIAAGLATLALAGLATAQEYRGPVRIFVGYPPGGTIDNTARVLAEKLREDIHASASP